MYKLSENLQQYLEASKDLENCLTNHTINHFHYYHLYTIYTMICALVSFRRVSKNFNLNQINLAVF